MGSGQQPSVNQHEQLSDHTSITKLFYPFPLILAGGEMDGTHMQWRLLGWYSGAELPTCLLTLLSLNCLHQRERTFHYIWATWSLLEHHSLCSNTGVGAQPWDFLLELASCISKLSGSILSQHEWFLNWGLLHWLGLWVFFFVLGARQHRMLPSLHCQSPPHPCHHFPHISRDSTS